MLAKSEDCDKDVTKFAEKFHLNFRLLADEDHAIAEKYGCWQEIRIYDKTGWGAARNTFVIGKDGKVPHVFENVTPPGHDKEVWAWIRGDA